MIKSVYEDSEKLIKLYEFWSPRQLMPNETFDCVFTLIDEKTKAQIC